MSDLYEVVPQVLLKTGKVWKKREKEREREKGLDSNFMQS